MKDLKLRNHIQSLLWEDYAKVRTLEREWNLLQDVPGSNDKKMEIWIALEQVADEIAYREKIFKAVNSANGYPL